MLPNSFDVFLQIWLALDSCREDAMLEQYAVTRNHKDLKSACCILVLTIELEFKTNGLFCFVFT